MLNSRIENRLNYAEPDVYEHEFYVTIFNKVGAVFLMVFALSAAAFIFIMTRAEHPVLGNIITCVFVLLMGIVVAINAKNTFSPGPRLKLSKEGLWTQKLGFIPWQHIRRTEIEKSILGKSSTIYLNIFGTADSDDAPGQSLDVSLLKWKAIQPIIDTYRKD